MGSVLSLPNSRKRTREPHEIPEGESCKRMRMSPSYCEESLRLIPDFPDEISLQILARLPRMYYLKAKLVSRRWRAALTSDDVFEVRKELGTSEEWLYILTKGRDDKLSWYAVDPVSGKWQRLPPMPAVPCEEGPRRGPLSGFQMWSMMGSGIRVANVIRGWLGRRNRLDQMPFSGCSVGAVQGHLYVLGGFSKGLAIKCVWRYDPRVNLWQEVSSMHTARCFCKTGFLNNKLYAVGGVSRGATGIMPLRSAEAFDPQTGEWTQMPNMPLTKLQEMPAAFFIDMLKPIATGLASYRGRLCVPQSLYTWPFFIDIGGEAYDPETNSWVDMPPGMGEGWPAKQAGTKLSVIVDGELYALDPSSSLVDGKIKIYCHQEDTWKVIIGKVPVHDFVDPECPYLLAGFHGKLHVITKDANNNTAVWQANIQNHAHSSPSTSSIVPVDSTIDEKDVWELIAAKNFGSAELVSCQVLDV